MKIEMRLFTIVVVLLVCGLFSLARGQDPPPTKPVRVVWDAPTAEEAQLLDGYNVYEITVTPAVRPADYAVNIPSPLPDTYQRVYRKLNTELIPKGTHTFVIPDARPGLQTIVRAWNNEWATESPDSDILTLRPLPGKVPGLKTTSLVLESSIDLRKWAELAIYEVAAIPPAMFYRLRF